MITKHISDYSSLDFSAGEVILVDKDPGLTSFNIVYKIRKSIQVKKVGHAGTLDPAATGLLIVCTGKKTKEISKYQELTKTYTGIITLGKSTPSFDAETDFISEKDYSKITFEDVEKARQKFVGTIKQIPPMYSALKINGKKLYHLARKGIEVERKPREVTIEKFEITKFDLPDIYFEIQCSKGTYIRVIANDVGEELGCGSYLKFLRRTGIGNYSVEDAVKIDEFILNQKNTLVN